MANIQLSYNWAIETCVKPNVGYSQQYRNQRTVNGITYYDCSSFVWYALIAGWVPRRGTMGNHGLSLLEPWHMSLHSWDSPYTILRMYGCQGIYLSGRTTRKWRLTRPGQWGRTQVRCHWMTRYPSTPMIQGTTGGYNCTGGSQARKASGLKVTDILRLAKCRTRNDTVRVLFRPWLDTERCSRNAGKSAGCINLKPWHMAELNA